MSAIRARHNLDGVEHLTAALKTMPLDVTKKGLRKAVNAGATPLVRAYRANVPVGRTGTLRRAVSKKVKFYAGSATYAAVVGAKADATATYGPEATTAVGGLIGNLRAGHKPRKHRPAAFAHFFESGVKPHAIAVGLKKSTVVINHPGFPGRNALRSAVDSTSAASLNAMQDKLAEAVEDAAAKFAK